MQSGTQLAIGVLLVLGSPLSTAWTRSGHMVSAAVAYHDLSQHDQRIIAQVDRLMAQHPDRAVFAVANEPRRGSLPTLDVFMAMARWPDDIRGGLFDHPTWHYASRPVVDARDPPLAPPANTMTGAALEAYALNMRVAGDRRAPPGERALALCWIFHLTGDIHQPLHAADLFSARFPEGDRGGGLQYVRDPRNAEAISLHVYWDGIVSDSGEPAQAIALARDLTARFPRAKYPQLSSAAGSADFAKWASESYAIARQIAYRNDLTTGAKQSEAKALSAAYAADSTGIAERQLTLSGYRLADVLRGLFP